MSVEVQSRGRVERRPKEGGGRVEGVCRDAECVWSQYEGPTGVGAAVPKTVSVKAPSE